MSSESSASMVVSVIIPCFDVEHYVDDCVRTVVDQSHRDLEIIAVDDGSMDQTGRMLDAWADRDERIRVIHQPNGGLGAARNAGVDAATGDALLFLDGDDFLPTDAIERLVASWAGTGSELVVGAIDVWQSGETWRATQQHRSYDDSHEHCSLSELPDLVYDSMVCSKLIHRSLWRRIGVRFRERVLFEDVDVTMQLYCLAVGIDVVPEPTYYWRRRTDGSRSITTQPVNDRSLTDRFDALLRAQRVAAGYGDSNVDAAVARKLIEVDVRRGVRQASEGGAATMSTLVEVARPLVESMPRAALLASPPMMHLVCEFIRERDAQALVGCERCFSQAGRTRTARLVRLGSLIAARPLRISGWGWRRLARR